MSDYQPSTYGDRWAEIYDELVERNPVAGDPDVIAGALAGLARGGPALELAVGTGRIALPLAARGLEVHGVEASEAMVAKLRDKPGGDAIPVTVGDMADVGVDGRYRLIYVVFNTFFALLTQEDQVRCFANVASHLTDDGVFVIEAFVPDLSRFDRGQRVQALGVSTDRVSLDVSRHDPLGQRVVVSHVVFGDDSVRLYPIQLRYAWPSELDLMARLAGLRLRDRWSGWDGAPFDSSSTAHVSVYAKG